jgi:hypothetical protein
MVVSSMVSPFQGSFVWRGMTQGGASLCPGLACGRPLACSLQLRRVLRANSLDQKLEFRFADSSAGIERWMLDVGRWTLDVGCWTLDAGRRTLKPPTDYSSVTSRFSTNIFKPSLEKLDIKASGSSASGIMTPRSLIAPSISSFAANAGGTPVCTTVRE